MDSKGDGPTLRVSPPQEWRPGKVHQTILTEGAILNLPIHHPCSDVMLNKWISDYLLLRYLIPKQQLPIWLSEKS